MRLLFFIFFLPSLCYTSLEHKFYVSVSDAVYNEEAEAIQMITRVFIDDFEEVLNLRYGTSISLEEGESSKETENLIEEYLKQKVKFLANGNEFTITYVGKQYDVDQLKLFIEVEQMKPFSEIEVTILLLTDLYDEQKNLFHLKKGEKTKSSVLVKDKSKALLKF